MLPLCNADKQNFPTRYAHKFNFRSVHLFELCARTSPSQPYVSTYKTDVYIQEGEFRKKKKQKQKLNFFRKYQNERIMKLSRLSSADILSLNAQKIK